MKVAIHQSQYLPWPPYFKKIAAAETFVLMDRVQFQKNGVQNRNKVRDARGDFWLTIPVTGSLHDEIKDKKIADSNWKAKHWKSIENSYRRAPRWKEFSEELEQLFSRSYSTLGEVNEAGLSFFLKRMGLKTQVVKLSQLQASGAKSELVLNICKELGASSYLSGMGAKSYLDENSFAKAGIELVYGDFPAPKYSQFHGEFIPELSALDMLLNVSDAELQDYLFGVKKLARSSGHE